MTHLPVPIPEDDSLAWMEELESTDPTAMAAHDQNVAMQGQLLYFANRGLRALAVLERDMAALKEATRRDVEAVVARWEALTQPLADRAQHIREGVISLYTSGTLRPQGNKKSVALESGTVGSRHHGPKVKVTDEAALDAWSRKGNGVMHTTLWCTMTAEKLDKKLLDEYVLTSGDLPDGVTLEPEGDDVFVKADTVEYPAQRALTESK